MTHHQHHLAMTFGESNFDAGRIYLEGRGQHFTEPVPPPVPPSVPIQFNRTEATHLSALQQQVFKQGVQTMMHDGRYRRLVEIHMQGQHRMHGLGGDSIGALRFLSWHRQYLMEFEAALGSPVPYWDWTQGFPAWLDDYLPFPLDTLPMDQMSNDIASGTRTMPRENRSSSLAPRLPNTDDIRAILEIQLDPVAPAGARYAAFSARLESGNSDLTAPPLIMSHNQVHVWVGGIMNTMASPADPVFWMHHAQVDRLWAHHQEKNPDLFPDIQIGFEKLGPWDQVTVSDVFHLQGLNYIYS